MTRRSLYEKEPSARLYLGSSLQAWQTPRMFEFQKLIAHQQRRERRLGILAAGGTAVAGCLGYLWLAVWIDSTIHLATLGRFIAWGGFLTLAAWLLLRVVSRARLGVRTQDEVALAIERRTGVDLENRLINTVQLSRDVDSSAVPMAEAVVAENQRALGEARLEDQASTGPTRLSLAAAALLAALGAGSWLMWPDRFENAASRILLPLADIAPLYRTTLRVLPGDVTVEPGASVRVDVAIEGRVPRQLVVIVEQAGQKSSEHITVSSGKRKASLNLEPARASLTYSVHGGDYSSPRYTVRVPTPLTVEGIKVVYRFPNYTRLPQRESESPPGDLEALSGTRAELAFRLNLPVEHAWLVVAPDKQERKDATVPARQSMSSKPPARASGREQKRALTRRGEKLFAGQVDFDSNRTFHVLAQHEGRKLRTGSYNIRALADEHPQLELGGVEPQSEVMIDSPLGLTATAHDDFGLADVGVFYRKVARRELESTDHNAADRWQLLHRWKVPGAPRQLHGGWQLAPALLKAVEGDNVELALGAKDIDPAKRGRWTMGTAISVRLASPEAALHALYRRILKGESAISELLSEQQELITHSAQWIKKFEIGSGVRWDDEKNLSALAEAMRTEARQQVSLRKAARQLSDEMVEEAGRLRLSIGMLGDTEIVRATTILEAVPKRERPQDKKAALADARLTQQRIVRSLSDILVQYVAFREDWEAAHMVAFTKSLADRQKAMAELSHKQMTVPHDSATVRQREASGRRQASLGELVGLAQKAFNGLGKREQAVGAIMAQAFREASQSIDSQAIGVAMAHAREHLGAGQWREAETAQLRAAESLQIVYRALRKAQTEAARRALDDLQELAASDVEAQKALDKLKAGTGENLIDFRPEELDLAEAIEVRKVVDQLKNKNQARPKDKTFDYLFEEQMKSMLEPAFVKGKGQDFSKLTLAKKPTGQMSFPNSSDRKANRVKAAVQDKVKDLVGDLLEEADDLRDQYETYNINAAFQTNEPGDVGKQGGDLNSTAASAATGNMKQPTQNFGGASRSGRQGARAHGLVVGDRSINRRGRDEAQQGQEDVARQQGALKETMSGDPQKDASTGRGGKVVDAEQTAFSTKDAGEWKDEDVQDMRAPQQQFQIVERKGKPLDPRVAEMMRDLTSRQEQVIGRIQAVKKELDQLYLPSDHLDDLMTQMAQNLDRLSEKPEAEMFRRQVELLDRLKSTVVVFDRPTTEYERASSRKQIIKGRVLDEPPVRPLPGYEDAVRRYYEKLSEL